MATAKVEGVQQKKSIFSAQPKNNNANGRDTIKVYYQRFLLPTIPEKPTPNYLKPTISSCHGTISQQPKISSSAAGAAAKRGSQMNVSHSPSSLPQRPPTEIRPKERQARSGPSTMANMARKRSLAKASKTPAGGRLFRSRRPPESFQKSCLPPPMQSNPKKRSCRTSSEAMRHETWQRASKVSSIRGAQGPKPRM
ncbi:hypothetical protein MUK42_33751 [Musa troglodytarum]|uniref:Uncharacterized protein n=1 Tax=Musa troglodytarum TaxID=320322 RepID=A0A9E7ECX5_9LILI|nr:hypothetical protein MUK42_33751 [Musa troglodytarum]